MAFRQRLKVATGCDTCRVRRKKCDESRPFCSACVRLHLTCSWNFAHEFHNTKSRNKTQGILHLPPNDDKGCHSDIKTETNLLYLGSKPLPKDQITQTETSNSIGTAKLKSPRYQVQQLPVIEFSNQEEEMITQQVPTFLNVFYAPTCTSPNRDISAMMQMIAGQPMVRNAVVSCLSINFPSSRNQLGEIDPVAYGKTIRSVQRTITLGTSNSTSLAALQIAVAFLGLTETTGSVRSPDPTRHCRVLPALMKRTNTIPLPRTIRLLLLESTIFNISTLSMFSTKWEPNTDTEGFYFAYRLLCQERDMSDQGFRDSPYLGGQYEIYKWILEVTQLSRYHSATVSNTKLDRMETDVRKLKARVDDIFAECGELDAYQSLAMIHRNHLLCSALLICILALRSTSELVPQQIDDLVSEGLHRFLHVEPHTPSRMGEMWPVMILACGIRHKEDLMKLQKKWTEIGPILDRGHRERGEELLAKLLKMAAKNDDTTGVASSDLKNKHIPRGLYLLRQKGGVLSRSQIVEGKCCL